MISMNLKEEDRYVVNRDEGLTAFDFGGDVSLAEKEWAITLEPQVRQKEVAVLSTAVKKTLAMPKEKVRSLVAAGDVLADVVAEEGRGMATGVKDVVIEDGPEEEGLVRWRLQCYKRAVPVAEVARQQRRTLLGGDAADCRSRMLHQRGEGAVGRSRRGGKAEVQQALKRCDQWDGKQQRGAWQLAEARLRLGSCERWRWLALYSEGE
ncbi:hypothetical protein BHM03_00039829 [Ensete ventricosum]|nr:hypothetical protein BHM03_00039829 [Ensete ventricosum]